MSENETKTNATKKLEEGINSIVKQTQQAEILGYLFEFAGRYAIETKAELRNEFFEVATHTMTTKLIEINDCANSLKRDLEAINAQ